MTTTAPKPKKWTKDSIIESIQKAHAEKGDVPTSTDMNKRLYGLPYPQAVINEFKSIPAAIKAAGYEPKGRAQTKANRDKIKAGMKRKAAGQSKNTVRAPRKAIKKATGTARPSAELKSAVADSISTAFARQEFCPSCETAYIGEHGPAECRDNLVERVNTMRASVEKFLPAKELANA